jgi:hypothetical protein
VYATVLRTARASAELRGFRPLPSAPGAAILDTGAREDDGGGGVAVLCAGYRVDEAGARAWAAGLSPDLAALGVRWIVAVRGPSDVGYAKKDLATAHVADVVTSLVRASGGDVLVVGHSSGSFVAHALLAALSGVDPERVAYADVDGGRDGLDGPALAHVRRAWLVTGRDARTHAASLNRDRMRAAAADPRLRGKAELVQLDVDTPPCGGATPRICVHEALAATGAFLSPFRRRLDVSSPAGEPRRPDRR